MKMTDDIGPALNALGNQASFVNLEPQEEQWVLELIEEIKSVFEQANKN